MKGGHFVPVESTQQERERKTTWGSVECLLFKSPEESWCKGEGFTGATFEQEE